MKEINVDMSRPMQISFSTDYRHICLFYCDKEKPEVIGYYRSMELDESFNEVKTIKIGEIKK